MSLNHSPSVVTNGLVMYLDAANKKSYPGTGTTWTDISGNSNTGTLTVAPTYSANNGGNFAFTGTQYVSTSYIQPAYNSSSIFTWNIWISSGILSNVIAIGNRAGGPPYNFIKIDNNLRFEYANSVVDLITPTGIILNAWYNICVVKNGSLFSYYINNTLYGTLTSTQAITNTSAFYVGGDPSASEYSTANISVVSIYNRALSAAEVKQNFNALRGRYGI